MENSVGLVERQYFTFAVDEPMPLDSGETLGPITLAYETYGQLNAEHSNAILILHALSGDAHAAGLNSAGKLGWWDECIGPGKAFDTDKYLVICSNVLGGCQGSTGPSSINPETGKPYGLHFPVITVGDMVRAQRHLIDYLGIKKLLALAGGSMGGMQALQWAVSYPERVCAALPLATTARHSPMLIALSEVGRQAIYADGNWNHGDYYDGPRPNTGLALARMIGHITYLSEKSMREKFGRGLQDRDEVGYDFGPPDFQVESYLRYKGDSFVERFDANSYLYITKAMDYFDLVSDHGSLVEAFKGVRSRFLVVSYSGDWLFPTHQSKEMVRALQANGVVTTFCELASEYGHDAFLLDDEQLRHAIREFLRHTLRDVRSRRGSKGT